MLRIIEQLKSSFNRSNWWTHSPEDASTVVPPKPRIHWVIPGKLAVGGFPQTEHSLLLSQAGIRAVLSLCADQEAPLPTDIPQLFRWQRFVLPDSFYTTELTVEQLAKAVAILSQLIQDQLPTYVHCLAGIERSPTVCIAYLCQQHHLELWEAMNWLKQVHPASLPTEAQVRVLREFVRGQNQRQKVS